MRRPGGIGDRNRAQQVASCLEPRSAARMQGEVASDPAYALRRQHRRGQDAVNIDIVKRLGPVGDKGGPRALFHPGQEVVFWLHCVSPDMPGY